MGQTPIRLVALMEANTVTGPAKALFFSAGIPITDLSVVAIVRQRDSAYISNDFIEAAKVRGIPIQVVRERFAFDTAIIGQLRRVFSRLKPDIVTTHAIKSHFLARGLRLAPRWVAFQHGYTATDLKMRLYNQLDRWSLPAADRVVTVCRPFAQALESTGVGRDRISVIPNAVEEGSRDDPAAARDLRRRFGIGEQEKIVLAIGRMSREKGYLDLIDAVAAAAKQLSGISWRLVLVGDGVLRQRISHAVERRGLTGRVVFAGYQSDVRPFYGMADLFVLPSHSEGSPLVLLEAMAAGVPIVATAVGGVPETVADGITALLVPPRDPAALSAALNQLLRNPEMARNLAERAAAIVERFSPAVYQSRLAAVYQSVCSGEARCR